MMRDCYVICEAENCLNRTGPEKECCQYIGCEPYGSCTQYVPVKIFISKYAIHVVNNDGLEWKFNKEEVSRALNK